MEERAERLRTQLAQLTDPVALATLRRVLSCAAEQLRAGEPLQEVASDGDGSV